MHNFFNLCYFLLQGFREKYHLDEVKKHNKFWKNLDTHKKWKHFGGNESEHEKESKGHHKTGKFKVRNI